MVLLIGRKAFILGGASGDHKKVSDRVVHILGIFVGRPAENPNGLIGRE
jgi:hypothetical protein